MFLSLKGSKVGSNEQEKILQSLKRKINPVQIDDNDMTWILDNDDEDKPLELAESSAGRSLEAGPSFSLK